MEKNVNAYWKVDVKAVSKLDFSTQLLKADANSYALTEIEGRPLVGESPQEITLKIIIYLPSSCSYKTSSVKF